MSLSEDFISKVCNAFRKAVESASEVTIEGREREFRRVLARYLFDETLGWEGYSKIGEIYDITCFDGENFPIILVETKWGVEPTREIKEKLRKRIEELGSVKYGVFANERDFIVYDYVDYKLEEITKVNVAEATGVARGEYGLSEEGRKRILRLELLKRERLVWAEEPEYFEKTYKEISVAKGEAVKLLTENLKDIIKDLTIMLMNFFDSYWKRNDYSGNFLRNTFNDWLKLSIKDEEFKKSDEKQKQRIIEIFCRETAYVLVGRILFIRICEDKNVLEPSLSGKGLTEFLKFYEKRKRENVYLLAFNESREEIKKYYSHLHELGFFDWWVIEEVQKGTLLYDDRKTQDDLEKDLDYSIKKTLRRLNRFDFTQVNRDILGDVYQGYLPPGERKQLGEFYTPREVIEYILDAVGYKPKNEIRGKKLLDPACGSGSFLVEATQRLIERYRRIGFTLENPDDAKQVIEGCRNSVYGLDIHPFACFIAEINLLFQLVDLYDVARQRDKYFKLPRLNIYRADSLVPSEPIELTEFLDNSRRKMLLEETKGADKVKVLKFEYVVGNPPYVRQERILNKEMLEKTYPEVFDGRADYCTYFITRGIEWLNDGGTFGYIVSGKFTKAKYGKYLRSHILRNTNIVEFVDLRGSKVFREATNDPVILILKKSKAVPKEAFNVVRVHVDMEGEKSEERIKKTIEHIKKNAGNEYVDKYIWCFKSSQNELIKGIKKIMGTDKEWCAEWILLPSKDEYISLLEKIRKEGSRNLEEICDVHYGIRPGLVKAFIASLEESKKLEAELLRPLLKGENVRRYRVDWQGFYIIYATRDVEISKYPRIENYLLQYKGVLENRKQFKQRRARGEDIKWYEIEQPVSSAIFESEKLLVPDISPRNNFAYDEGKYYCLDSSFIITMKSEHTPLIKYLLGLLNSSTLELYFKQIAAYLGKKGYRYKKQYLDKLPIKFPQTIEEKIVTEEITQIVDRILQLYRQVQLAKNKIQTFPRSYFEENWSFNKLMDVIKAQTLSQPAYTISADLPRTDYLLKDLNGRETFRIIFASDEYIDFYDEHVASYVFEVLKTMKSITKRELLELKISAQPHLKNLMNQYRKDKEQIVKNEKEIEELEKQIDDLVYKLYDITYAERRIIEDYLKKF